MNPSYLLSSAILSSIYMQFTHIYQSVKIFLGFSYGSSATDGQYVEEKTGDAEHISSLWTPYLIVSITIMAGFRLGRAVLCRVVTYVTKECLGGAAGIC